MSNRLRRGRQWAAGKYREVPLRFAGLRARLAGRGASGPVAGRVNPENVVWIFGTGRSGSTWLRSMMTEVDRHQLWEEPLVGRLFGDFYQRSQRVNLRRPDYVMGDPTRKGWIHSIRNFVLDGAGYACPFLGPQDYLVVKEPNGSVGAPLLMEALPESRMILLVRDPRDVVASTLDGARKGNWLHEWTSEGRKDGAPSRRGAMPDDPDAFVQRHANGYLSHAGNAKKAYDAHKGRKVLIRYEDLRADTLATVKHLYSALEIPAEAEQLVGAVEKHSWESIPEKEKGAGKFYRKATPGGWREDLTPEQARWVESTTAPLLKEFGYQPSAISQEIEGEQRNR